MKRNRRTNHPTWATSIQRVVRRNRRINKKQTLRTNADTRKTPLTQMTHHTTTQTTRYSRKTGPRRCCTRPGLHAPCGSRDGTVWRRRRVPRPSLQLRSRYPDVRRAQPEGEAHKTKRKQNGTKQKAATSLGEKGKIATWYQFVFGGEQQQRQQQEQQHQQQQQQTNTNTNTNNSKSNNQQQQQQQHLQHAGSDKG